MTIMSKIDKINDIDNINEVDSTYTIHEKRIADVLNDIEFDTKEDKNICKSIILQLEKIAARNIVAYKTVNIPYIGCIRRSNMQKAMQDNYINFRLARKHLNIDDYREHVRGIIYEAKVKEAKQDEIKTAIYKIRQKNKKQYKKLATTIGYRYAELYIYAIYLLKEIPYSQEFEDYYKSLKD